MDQVYRRGDRGPAVTRIAQLLARLDLLGGSPGDIYDDAVERGVRAFQQQRGLTVDGVVGGSTYRRLDEARWSLGDRILTHLPGRLIAGDDVFALQQRLLELGFDAGRADGHYGPATEAAVKEFQRNVGIPPDGTCGPATLKSLAQLRPIVRGGAPNALRAQERVRAAGPALTGKVIVIDATRADNLPASYRHASDQVVHDIARRIEGRLIATGVQAYLTAAGAGPDDGRARHRAGFANAARADVCLSLALDSSSHPHAGGLATYFFGSQDHVVWSTTGERLAGLVQREILARTDLVDLRTHPKTWDFLRHTRMPAVRIEPGYLTNDQDARRLDDPSFRDVLAEAVVAAVQRFFLDPEIDPHTGTLRFGAAAATWSLPDSPR